MSVEHQINYQLEKMIASGASYTEANHFMVERPRINRQTVERGIKVFDGNPIPSAALFATSDHEDYLRYTARVWRTEDTLESARLLQTYGRLVVEGAPQSGKGTILYGLSTICDAEGWGYMFIDGHRQEVSGESVAEQIYKANEEGKIIFYDSFDYNFAGPKKIRRVGKAEQLSRVATIVGAISNVTVPVVLTQHDSYWRQVFLDQNLVTDYSQFFNQFPVYELPRSIQSDISRISFLVDHSFTYNEAHVLLSLPHHREIGDFVNAKGSGDALDELTLALKDYGTLKILARDLGEDSINNIRSEVKRLVSQIENDIPGAVVQLAELVMTVHTFMDFEATLRYHK